MTSETRRCSVAEPQQSLLEQLMGMTLIQLQAICRAYGIPEGDEPEQEELAEIVSAWIEERGQ